MMKLSALRMAIVASTVGLAVPAMAGTVTSEGADLVINTKGGLSVATTDKDYSFEVGGRIQYDYNRAELNGNVDEDQFDIRRARLFVKGDVAGDWSYKAQFNVDSGGAEDLYIRYKGLGKKAVVTAGRQKMPFGLEELTSSKDISVLERSAITEAYAIGRADGVQLSGAEGNFTYAVALFEGDGSGTTNDLSYAARATFAPVVDDDTVIHLGVAYKDHKQEELFDDSLFDNVEAIGLEAAAVFGPAHIQAEYVDADSDNLGNLDGFYVQAGWVITGEQRPYKDGVFKRIKPAGDKGAVEVVVRYEDGDGDYGDIELGADNASAWGLGVNWYVNNNVRLGVNYTDGESDTSSDDGEEFRTRIQLTF